MLRASLLILLSAGAVVGCGRGAPPPRAAPAAISAAPASERPYGTAEVDAAIAAAWDSNGITPAPPADDATFARRAYLDLVGRIPTVEEARRFAGDRSPDKRGALVDALLASPGYADRWTTYWEEVLFGDRSTRKPRFDRSKFHEWLHGQLAKNVPYDRWVFALVSANGLNFPLSDAGPAPAGPPMPLVQTEINGAVNWLLQFENAPGDAAAAVASTFLGVRLSCAQCHDDKFERWRQSDFRQFAACFTRTKAVPTAVDPRGKPRQFGLFDTIKPIYAPAGTELETIVKSPPVAIDGTPLDRPPSRREALAEWLVSPRNRWFARTVVNRLWERMLGRGFVEPIDDFRESVPPLLPEVLDGLSRQLVKNGFDLRRLLATIAKTRVYQLASYEDAIDGRPRVEPPSDQEAPLWSRYALKPLDPDVLLDSLAIAADLDGKEGSAPLVKAKRSLKTRLAFVFDTDERRGPASLQPTVAQALLLMNGRALGQATAFAKERPLLRILSSPIDDGARIDALYLRTLSRLPTESERSRALAFLSVPSAERVDAFEDLFWVLVNSTEFVFNH